MAEDIFIVGAARTPIGGFGGSLRDLAPSQLGSHVIAEALRRAGCPADQVEHVVLGNVIPCEPRDGYLARVAALGAGVPAASGALTVNRLCGSGAQAIVSVAQMIRLGECDVAVAGGAESMSNAPFLAPDVRWGRKMGDAALIDTLLAALHDPFGHGHMGMTAERVAERCGVGRERQDEIAAQSHQRAARAIAEGRFESQIAPVEIKDRKGVKVFSQDEHVRPDTTVESLASLKPAFKRDGGVVTAGNASGINDGAAAVALMSANGLKRTRAAPMARVIGWGYAGVEPEVMGLGPIPAVPMALARAGVKLEQVDVIESNEAFAAQACAVADALGFDAEKTNPNGGAIALGHPLGATGAILTVKALYELQRIGGRYALVTMCIGGGQGIALVLDRQV